MQLLSNSFVLRKQVRKKAMKKKSFLVWITLLFQVVLSRSLVMQASPSVTEEP